MWKHAAVAFFVIVSHTFPGCNYEYLVSELRSKPAVSRMMTDASVSTFDSIFKVAS